MILIFLVNFNIFDDKFATTYFLNPKIYISPIVAALHGYLTCFLTFESQKQQVKLSKKIKIQEK